MTFTEPDLDPDVAQARLFRDLLHEEIAVLTARIDTTRARDGRLGAEDPESRARLGEARQLVARLTARYPELRDTGRPTS
ncbi:MULTISPECIES: hypothetical protein [unclassified Rhodococcus (in: high G+C Gram-positive bacteria)]|uniref:hypothetical protein n=1 Tax=unclassified Rhodococcus (in: high G+C Gram-positive bacteria) TaxID=192944 RepID=UPI00163B522B|nr:MULTISPECIES: hypothetical protein [unclassified Rhodococcus (in: high G+C Gram-positive bacteria)]MBC2638230.1 hypothetical protein [Rhodococcus sp. 3A]MBC2897027.1 hypothetical protein [Rhodococcus sp. 4CII]